MERTSLQGIAACRRYTVTQAQHSDLAGFLRLVVLEEWCPGEDSNLHALASAST